MAHEPLYLRRWAASLRRTAAATQAEAEAHGPHWEYYRLSLSSAQAQLRQAEEYESTAEQVERSTRS
jgi:hypothetical protein